jgi:type IV pilus assembly protein PilE
MINDKKGFTLIELMVVVAIIGVLTAIAYPSYDAYMKKTRRSDAKVALTKVIALEERYNSPANNFSYATTLGALNLTTTSEDGYYTISISAPTPTSGYTVTATAVAGKPQAGDTTTSAGDCRVLKISSTGVKTPAACW